MVCLRNYLLLYQNFTALGAMSSFRQSILLTGCFDRFIDDVDCIQVGARNMQNFDLLRQLGKINKPVLLKRGLSATIEEWLMSAEYILSGGNEQVILCERGIRTFEPYTRNTVDIGAVPVVKRLSHLPVIVDPSHGTGKRWCKIKRDARHT